MPCCHRRPESAYTWDISTLPHTVSTNRVKHVCNGIAPHSISYTACFSAGYFTALVWVTVESQHSIAWWRAGMSLVTLKVNQRVVIFTFWQLWTLNSAVSPPTSMDGSLYKPLIIMLLNYQLQVWIYLYILDLPYASVSPVWYKKRYRNRKAGNPTPDIMDLVTTALPLKPSSPQQHFHAPHP